MTQLGSYDEAMARALSLASRGPAGINPQVGCVLLDADGTVVAEGWHHGVGTPHAEVDALRDLAERRGVVSTGSTRESSSTRDGSSTGENSGIAAGLTAVVTLEPCNHTGHTGPCSVALIDAGIARVVYALSDPTPLASGGAERLRDAGVEVIGGVLAADAAELLRPWIIAQTRSRPFVTVKWASTLDGRAAASDGSSQWITGTASRQKVHEQRAAADAILIGTGTVLADDPSLTARGDGGELLEHQPLPVVIGERAVPMDAKLWQHPRGLVETHTRDLPTALSWLFEQGVRRVFVEGGPTLASAFVAADLVDEYLIYLAPKLLGGDKLALGDIGVTSITEAHDLRITHIETLGDDILVIARPKER